MKMEVLHGMLFSHGVCYSRTGLLYHESDGGRAGREEEIRGIDGDLEVIGETHLCSLLYDERTRWTGQKNGIEK